MFVTIGLGIVLFIGYRLYNYNRVINSVTVHKNILHEKGTDNEGEVGFTKKYEEISENEYNFSLSFKDYFIEGSYIFQEKLTDKEICMFIAVFEKGNDIYFDLEYKQHDLFYKSSYSTHPKYFFVIKEK